MAQQRLPIVNSDDGQWGDILRQYLSKEHFNDDTDSAANGGHKNITVRAGTSGAGGAPLKLTSGTLLTTPEIGAIEFAGDNLYLTQTSSTIRKKVAIYDDATGATGDIYYRSSVGYFTRLPAGSTSQVLTITSGLPSWQTPTAVTGAFSDSAFALQDNGDATKQAKFEVSGITTATTRTITVQNLNGTMYVTGGQDVSVADGGTGRSTSTTAYGIIAAGTTATGAHQTIAPGTSGQFLKSAGASALASFAAITAADITGTTAQFNAALTDNDFATLAGSEILTNKTINGANNTISNIPWSGVSGKPAVIAAGSNIGEALSAVNLTQIVGGQNDADGRFYGAFARNALYSLPESVNFVPIPHAYNDIAYNNDRGGSVKVLLNSTVIANDGNNAPEAFTPDATFSTANFYSSTSDLVVLEITLHRTFFWSVNFGIQQTDWCRAQNVKFEGFVNGAWVTWTNATNEATGLTWASADAGSNGMTKLRITLTNFNVAASTGIRISQIFLIGYDSSLLSGTFLPRGGGVLYGELGTPAVWTDRIKDRLSGAGIVEFYSNPSAVNYLQFQNRATGNGPSVYAQGADANIDINLMPKGTGSVKINGATLPTASSIQTLTNKTINAPDNTITNISTSNLADSSITSAKIVDGAIVDTDINAAAAIALSKLATGRVEASVNGTATTTLIWRGTQAQYDAIGTKDTNTLYFIAG